MLEYPQNVLVRGEILERFEQLLIRGIALTVNWMRKSNERRQQDHLQVRKGVSPPGFPSKHRLTAVTMLAETSNRQFDLADPREVKFLELRPSIMGARVHHHLSVGFPFKISLDPRY